jgi:uncharacterized short protein YbdD (DUF466 family)
MDVASPLSRGASGVRDGLRGVAWFVRGVLGEDAYDKYRDHHDAVHGDDPDAPPPMTVKQFWRDRTDRQETNPEGRCC